MNNAVYSHLQPEIVSDVYLYGYRSIMQPVQRWCAIKWTLDVLLTCLLTEQERQLSQTDRASAGAVNFGHKLL